MRYFILGVFLFVVCSVSAQKELISSQYMHNKYAINPGFGGSREVFSVAGAYRKQWVGMEGSPSQQFFSAHTPLKKEQVALGIQIFNESYAVANSTGFSASYTYRLRMGDASKLCFGINGGLLSFSSDWDQVKTIEPGDPMYASGEASINPIFGFGSCWYGKKFFAGVSVPSLLYYDRADTGESSVELSKIDYLFTGGYLFSASNVLDLQPSCVLKYNPNEEALIDFSLSGIVRDVFWVGGSYRTNKELVGFLGYQVNEQLKIGYSLDYITGELSSYNNGTHEISIQYDFSYKLKTASPKFF